MNPIRLTSLLGRSARNFVCGPLKTSPPIVSPQMEAMEARRLFSVAPIDDGGSTETGKPKDEPGPRVSAVFVNSTQWSPAFRAELENLDLGSSQLGFAVPGGDAQLDDLPWANINQVSVRFNEPVSLTEDALRIRGRIVRKAGQDHGVGKPLDIASFSYDPATKTATATLAEPIDRATVLRVQLRAKDVLDDDHRKLDGEWNDGDDHFASGDGEQGGDFDFRINVLPGDVNRNGIVNATDLVLTRNRVGLAISRPGDGKNTYSVFADVDGSGVINAPDLVLVRNHIGQGIERDDHEDDHGHDGQDD